MISALTRYPQVDCACITFWQNTLHLASMQEKTGQQPRFVNQISI
jgi:hypothetical protein